MSNLIKILYSYLILTWKTTYERNQNLVLLIKEKSKRQGKGGVFFNNIFIKFLYLMFLISENIQYHISKIKR